MNSPSKSGAFSGPFSDYARPRYQASGRFDTALYLATYPDIRAAVSAGRIDDMERHWFELGRHEVVFGARAMAREYDESRYLALRPDVAAAIAAGDFVNGYDHWLRWGRAEMERAGELGHLDHHLAVRPALLTDEQIRFWNANGFIVLKQLISAERCDRIADRIGDLWRDRSLAPPVTADIDLDSTNARRVRFCDAPEEARASPYKLNDMFLSEEAVQDLVFDETLTAILAWVLDAEPVCCGSLNFERSSTQGYHQDTLYMPGKRHGGMTAAWFALEDVAPAAGPLAYYPGSHRIPLYHFSSGLPNQIDAEVEGYSQFMSDQVAVRGLEPAIFLPQKGDVLIWHERLFHAGSPIQNRSLTRRSLVAHYWRVDDLPQEELKRRGTAYYWNRPPIEA